MELEILGAERRALLDRWHTLGEGARRPLVLKPRDLQVSGGEPGSLVVSFSLPKGAYATTVLDAACEVVDVMRPGASRAGESGESGESGDAEASLATDAQN
jgi:tRNA(Glu) U13 pseudouridine synthase TruD